MPITLNHSNIGVQYSSDKSYIIETVKSDLYRRNENVDTVIRNNIQTAPVTPTTYVDNSGNVYAVESYTYTGTANTADFTRVFPTNTTCDILVVGGGGGGGYFGGGGGGGAILFANNLLLNTGSYTIKVGKGGTGASNDTANGTNGINSSISINAIEYIAKGGGGGGTRFGAPNHVGRNGNEGGSGGGGSHADNSPQGLGGGSNKNTYTNWLSYGNNGGTGKLGVGGAAPTRNSGGGGGAGSIGANISSTGGGNGGTGISFVSTFGTSVGHSGWFGGGGGGNTYTGAGNPGYGNGGNGLLGGGGNGGFDGDSTLVAQDGLPNTGGGGGGSKISGGTAEDLNGGHGGSGIVIIRYLLGTIPATNILMNEPTVIAPTFTETIRTFMHSGGTEAQTTHTITVGRDTICDILIVGGGGAGGTYIGGGGGAGGVLYITNCTIPVGTYNIQVGKGGTGVIGGASGTTAQNGSSSKAFGIEVFGGGYGGVGQWGTSAAQQVGANGGSGGGGGSCYTGTAVLGGTVIQPSFTSSVITVNNYNYYGGNGAAGLLFNYNAQNSCGANGGGGAGGNAPANTDQLNAGPGADGIQINIDGNNYFWGGGGGGGLVGQVTNGGKAGNGGKGGGGGGSGSQLSDQVGIGGIGGISLGQDGDLEGDGTPTAGNGGPGTGGGGGGCGRTTGSPNPVSGSGGSGIVIIKFKSIVNPVILEGVTHKRLNYIFNQFPLIYDFTQYNTEAVWKAYAATIPNFTYSLDSFLTAFDPDAVWIGNYDVGWVQMTLPSGYNFLTITYGLGSKGEQDVRLLINGVLKSSATTTNRLITYSQEYNVGDVVKIEETFSTMNANFIFQFTNTNSQTYTLNFPVPTLADINNNSNIVLRGAYDIALSTSNAIIIPKTGQYIPKPTTFTNYSIERMYPPVRNFSAATTVVSGQTYGNGTYVVSYSSTFGSSYDPFKCFNTSDVIGGAWATSRYTDGVFNSTSFIVSGYLGDWLKIQLPVAIRLTRFSFLQRISATAYSPKDFKIYGSNDNITWVELVNKTDAVYNASYIYEQTTPEISNTYTYYGLVVNKVFSPNTQLNFDEWYIYGQEASTSSLSLRYHLLNPTLDPIGAQWTYSSNNTNVYHMGSVGIGTTRPEYQLDVRGAIYSSVGGYTQTGLTSWSITSDRRIKENITRASYDICLENVKNIELYNFNFKNNCVNTNDKHQLGFIAQEVQQVYPKAVEVGKMILNTNEEINDILTLNTTQIDYTLYGAVKNLIEKIEGIDNDLENIEKLI